MRHLVEERRHRRGVTEELPPVLDRPIRGQDGGHELLTRSMLAATSPLAMRAARRSLLPCAILMRTAFQ